MNTYIALSAIMMFIAFALLIANIAHYGIVCYNRESTVLHQTVKATQHLKRIASKIDVMFIGSIFLFVHQWAIMNFVTL